MTTKNIMRAFRLDEISAVDRPAQAGAKMVIMKRDGGSRIDELADMMCEADPTIEREAALNWLLHSPRGQALVRLHKNEEPTMTTHGEDIAYLAKRGAPAVAKAIVEGGIPGLSEHEFTKLVHDHAQRDRRSGESADQAFARCFGADTDEGRTIRQAHQMTKRFPNTLLTAPVQVGGVGDLSDDALAQLQRLAEEQRRRSPTLTIEQAFAQVYGAQENAELVARERLQNRPRATATTIA